MADRTITRPTTSEGAAERPSSRERVRATARSRAEASRGNLERAIMGVPARIMRPRLLLIGVTVLLVCFGLVMIYSASSVEALSEQGSANYYVIRQFAFIIGGAILAFAAAKIDYHTLCKPTWLMVIGLGVCVMLLVVRVAGSTAGGATRWLAIGPFRLQPSEFAKASVLLATASIANGWLCEQRMEFKELVVSGCLFLGLPLVLILFQPDKGSTMIICAMIFVVAYYAGLDRRLVRGFLIFVVAVGLVLALKDDYSRQRIITMFNPEADEWDSGYQLTRGFYAFASGGIKGVGLGMSRMKYSYLPEAHNDFIFAIVGEELGLLGTLFVLAMFAFLAYQAFEISRNASDNEGRLLAIGAATLLLAQLFLNVFGVLGLFPLSGKPLPFISYGGSSIMSCLILVGLIVNVSIHSKLPETAYDRNRARMRLADEEDTGVSEPHTHPRGAYAARTLPAGGVASARRDETMVRERPRTASTPLASASEARSPLRVVDGGGGRERIDLGPDARDRLRGGNGGPTVRTSEGRGSAVPRSREGGRGGSRGRNQRRR